MWTIWCTGSNRPCPPCWACWASGGTPSTLPTSSANWPCVCAAPRSLSSALHRVSCTRHAPRATCDASTESLSWDSHVAETIPRSHTNGKRRSVHKVEVCPALTICNYILYIWCICTFRSNLQTQLYLQIDSLDSWKISINFKHVGYSIKKDHNKQQCSIENLTGIQINSVVYRDCIELPDG